MRRDRVYSASQVLRIKRETLELDGPWNDCLGPIDRQGVVFVYGQSGNGKSSCVMSLCKELTKHGRVLYVSLEEGYSLSIQNTLLRYNMVDCGNRFQMLDQIDIQQLDERLSQKGGTPKFVVIDSFQYTQMSYRDYVAFKRKHSNKLLIFVSHADGKQPAGRAAKSVNYDADLKIWVEGYKAFSNGRFIGITGEYTIWPEGAEKYWGKKL